MQTRMTKQDASSAANTLEDGVYTAEFDTDSGMFHVNEANDGKGTLTVKDGKDDHPCEPGIQKDRQPLCGNCRRCCRKTEPNSSSRPQILLHTATERAEEVYGFDIPVPAIDEEFDVAHAWRQKANGMIIK